MDLVPLVIEKPIDDVALMRCAGTALAATVTVRFECVFARAENKPIERHVLPFMAVCALALVPGVLRPKT